VALGLVVAWLALRKDIRYYSVASGSMEPTLQVGRRVAVDVDERTPRLGDIIAFHAPVGAESSTPVCGAGYEGDGSTAPCGIPTPQESSVVFIKRVAAGPGSEVSIAGGHAVVNGHVANEPYIAACGDDARCSFPTSVYVPPGSYFLLGDNRGVSDDSRFWGPIPSAWIIGTVVRCSSLRTSCRALH